MSTKAVTFFPGKGRMLSALCLLPLFLDAQPSEPVWETLGMSRQMVVVTARDWNATDGSIQRFERDMGRWQPVGPCLPVVLGSNGLAWGLGLHPPHLTGPQKREGDGRSPAGVFRLPYCFGYAPADAVRSIKLPYIECTVSVECINDTNSAYYNIIKDRLAVEKVDWKSSEKMRLADDEYRLGVFVEHNGPPAQPGGGSCIFLHIWKGPRQPTAGSTAMSAGAIESLVGWLDPRSNPILVQLPLTAYARLQPDWRLPPTPSLSH
jgi:L,D-peptidoglycan transpeptidase YkuD (ErfK/YbiS/YcfS/YnhG family)